MPIIKRLHRFVLKTFLPLFAMTFFIVLFIVLMQFLWKYIDDLVGKGLSMDVLGELFFYAAVSMVPMSLPLAILLASLMTFGNMGERFELTAMKASGISLLKVMAPLIVFISAISVGAFFFQNDVLPHAQVKMWTLLFSVKQKSPEVEIPEGVFYDQIPGYNLFVQGKNKETGMLYDVMIYDVNSGGDNSIILRADSAQLAFTKDMRYLYLHLFRGEQFENLKQSTGSDQYVPFRRENFEDKQILIPFDANFNRMDEEGMRKQYVGKNIAELRQTIDSVSARVDSIGSQYTVELGSERLVGLTQEVDQKKMILLPTPNMVKMPKKMPDLDSILAQTSEGERARLLKMARDKVGRNIQAYEFKSVTLADDQKSLRRHRIELIKKFTLSVACLIMFFIGAPLGAIIRKGGLGTPLVISVLLFLVYYIIDNTGYKMARDGRWVVWMGMWMSTFILAPLGIYVTYKAMNDSAVFDKDAYLNLMRRLLGIKGSRKVERKEVIINDISEPKAIDMLVALRHEALKFNKKNSRPETYHKYWLHGYNRNWIRDIADELDATIEYLRDCRDNLLVNKLADYPVVRSLRIYQPSQSTWMSWCAMILFPVGIPVWLVGIKAQSNLKAEMRKVADVTIQVLEMLGYDEPDMPDEEAMPEDSSEEITASETEAVDIDGNSGTESDTPDVEMDDYTVSIQNKAPDESREEGKEDEEDAENL